MKLVVYFLPFISFNNNKNNIQWSPINYLFMSQNNINRKKWSPVVCIILSHLCQYIKHKSIPVQCAESTIYYDNIFHNKILSSCIYIFYSYLTHLPQSHRQFLDAILYLLIKRNRGWLAIPTPLLRPSLCSILQNTFNGIMFYIRSSNTWDSLFLWCIYICRNYRPCLGIAFLILNSDYSCSYSYL